MTYEQKFDASCVYDRFKAASDGDYWYQELLNSKVDPTTEQMGAIKRAILGVMVAGLDGMTVDQMRLLKRTLLSQHTRTSPSSLVSTSYLDIITRDQVVKLLSMDPEQTYQEVNDLFPVLDNDTIYRIVLNSLAEEQMATLAKKYGC
jgi:regulator of protease activity HflC (stomatin/prohibitin superfamily)